MNLHLYKTSCFYYLLGWTSRTQGGRMAMPGAGFGGQNFMIKYIPLIYE